MTLLRKIGQLNRDGMQACNAGKVENAMFQLIQADRLARELKSPLHAAKIRNNIGLVHEVSGNAQEAMACYRLAARFAVQGAGEGNVLHKAIARNLQRAEALGEAA